MKKIAISALSALTLTAAAFAGQPMVSSGKDKVVLPEPCFNDTELQLDVFGSYTWADGDHGDGFGGGLGLNYFLTRNIGLGVEGNIYDGDANGVWNVDARLLFRYPIDSACLAPYAFVAGGVQTNGGTEGTIGVGGGIEYRVVSQKVGLFTEGRYTWAADSDDSAQVRVGVRVVF